MKKKTLEQKIMEKGVDYFADLTAPEAAELVGCKVRTFHSYARQLGIPYLQRSTSQAPKLTYEERLEMVVLCHERGPVHAARVWGVSRHCVSNWYERMAEELREADLIDGPGYNLGLDVFYEWFDEHIRARVEE